MFTWLYVELRFYFTELFLANLVPNRTGSFTSGLTRVLALAAAAGLKGMIQFASDDGFNQFHL